MQLHGPPTVQLRRRSPVGEGMLAAEHGLPRMIQIRGPNPRRLRYRVRLGTGGGHHSAPFLRPFHAWLSIRTAALQLDFTPRPARNPLKEACRTLPSPARPAGELNFRNENRLDPLDRLPRICRKVKPAEQELNEFLAEALV